MKKVALIVPLISTALAIVPVRADTKDSVEFARVKCPGAVEGIFPADLLPTTSTIPLIDKLVVDTVERETGLDVDYRLYGPGASHWGQSSFTSAITLGASKELKAWFDEAAKGKNIRKHISVTVVETENTPGKSFLLYDCFPVAWTGFRASARYDGAKDTSSPVSEETITVKVGRIDFKT